MVQLLIKFDYTKSLTIWLVDRGSQPAADRSGRLVEVMDNMEDMLSAMQGLPGFSPFGALNWSGTCAASRLVQCRLLGVTSVAMEEKVREEYRSYLDNLGTHCVLVPAPRVVPVVWHRRIARDVLEYPVVFRFDR